MSLDAKQVIDDLLEVLVVERQAIRTLDGAAVADAAKAKELFAEQIASVDVSGFRDELAVLRSELRRNGILLAHARTCLREASSLSQNRVKTKV